MLGPGGGGFGVGFCGCRGLGFYDGVNLPVYFNNLQLEGGLAQAGEVGQLTKFLSLVAVMVSWSVMFAICTFLLEMELVSNWWK